MKRFKSIFLIINLKSLFIVTLSVASTHWCRRWGLTADFPLALVTMAVVFPIVFSIGGAYKRREAALDDYGALKAHGRAVYFAARDWLAERDDETVEACRRALWEVMDSVRQLFMGKVEAMPANEDRVYRSFSQLSLFVNGLRAKGLATGEVSRCNQYVSKMFHAFEHVKHVYQYRTPQTLRAFSDVFIVLLPVLYGPYFAQVGGEMSPGLEYVLPVLLSLILVSLDNIQDHLEDPFDQIGEDDVEINAEKFLAKLDP